MFHRFGALMCIAVVALFASLLGGCGNKESGYVGKWELDKDAFKATLKAEMEKEQGGDDEGMAAFAAAMMMGVIDSMQMDVEIKKDHTFVATTNMQGQTDTATGTWKLEGDSIRMTSPNEEPGQLTLKNGKLHLKIDSQPDQPTMIFKKKK